MPEPIGCFNESTLHQAKELWIASQNRHKSCFYSNVKELIYDGRLFLPELGTFASYWAAFCALMVEWLDMNEDHTKKSVAMGDADIADEVYRDLIWNMESLGAGDDMKKVLTGDCKELYMNLVDSLVRYTRLLDQQEESSRQVETSRLCVMG